MSLIWTPSDAIKLELVAPRPRIARRITYAGDVEDWLYLAGEFGGGTWAIRRASGVDDLVTYRDWRIVLGIERKALHALDARLEVGYVFARQIEFAGPTADLTPGDTLMLRSVVTY